MCIHVSHVIEYQSESGVFDYLYIEEVGWVNFLAIYGAIKHSANRR